MNQKNNQNKYNNSRKRRSRKSFFAFLGKNTKIDNSKIKDDDNSDLNVNERINNRKLRRYNRKKRRFRFTFISVIFAAIIFFLALQSSNITGFERAVELKRWQKYVTNNPIEINPDAMDVRALRIYDRGSETSLIDFNASNLIVPANFTTLFVIDYATTLCQNSDIVNVSRSSLKLVPANATTVGLREQEYTVENLYQAILVGSGGDATYALADYCGKLLASEEDDKENSQHNLELFKNGLNKYLKEKGFTSTKITDPTGTVYSDSTSIEDLHNVLNRLLSHQWFRKQISQSQVSPTLPNKEIAYWKNQNAFVNSDSEYYNFHATGVMVASASDWHNLVILYELQGNEYLLFNFGSKTTEACYKNMTYYIKTLNEYLDAYSN